MRLCALERWSIRFSHKRTIRMFCRCSLNVQSKSKSPSISRPWERPGAQIPGSFESIGSFSRKACRLRHQGETDQAPANRKGALILTDRNCRQNLAFSEPEALRK
jgi:hypothetical protein